MTELKLTTEMEEAVSSAQAVILRTAFAHLGPQASRAISVTQVQEPAFNIRQLQRLEELPSDLSSENQLLIGAYDLTVNLDPTVPLTSKPEEIVLKIADTVSQIAEKADNRGLASTLMLLVPVYDHFRNTPPQRPRSLAGSLAEADLMRHLSENEASKKQFELLTGVYSKSAFTMPDQLRQFLLAYQYYSQGNPK